MPAENALARWTRASNGGAFRAVRWALALPTIRTGRGHTDDKLRMVAFVLAVHADGETGENSFPGLERIAREAHLSGKKEATEVLARGEELGLWESEEDASEWGTTQWCLAIDDAELFVRLEKMELERTEHKRQQKSSQWTRYRARQGQSTDPARNSEDGVTGRRVSAPVLQGHSTGTAGSVDSPCRVSAPVLQGLPRPTNQPSGPALADQPSGPALAARRTPPSASPNGDRVHSPQSGQSKEPRRFVRGLENAFAAGMVSRQELEQIADLENELAGRVAGRG